MGTTSNAHAMIEDFENEDIHFEEVARSTDVLGLKYQPTCIVHCKAKVAE